MRYWGAMWGTADSSLTSSPRLNGELGSILVAVTFHLKHPQFAVAREQMFGVKFHHEWWMSACSEQGWGLSGGLLLLQQPMVCALGWTRVEQKKSIRQSAWYCCEFNYGKMKRELDLSTANLQCPAWCFTTRGVGDSEVHFGILLTLQAVSWSQLSHIPGGLSWA